MSWRQLSSILVVCGWQGVIVKLDDMGKHQDTVCCKEELPVQDFGVVLLVLCHFVVGVEGAMVFSSRPGCAGWTLWHGVLQLLVPLFTLSGVVSARFGCISFIILVMVIVSS